MTKPRDYELELARLEEELVDDIVSMSDEELLAEAKKDGVDVVALGKQGRELISNAILMAGKAKLAAAKAAVKAASERPALRVIQGSMQEKQKIIQAVMARQAEGPERLTLAARNANELTENDVDLILQNLIKLGLLNEDGQPK